MSADKQTEREYAARLLRALESADDASCDEMEALLPTFVEAEQSGLDVESDPAFARLLTHLDHCERCVERYVALSADLAALTDAAETSEPVRAAPPAFFAPARQHENVVLRVLRGLTRRFELVLPLPQLSTGVAVLGPGDQVPLFVDTVNDVAGAPRLRVVLSAGTTQPAVQVIVRETTQRPWQVQLTVGERLLTAQTDERGVAEFPEVAIGDADSILVRCSELSA